MKLPVLLLSLLLLALLLPPAGHGARHRHYYVGSGHCLTVPRLLPLRVLRTSQAEQQPKIVRVVQ